MSAEIVDLGWPRSIDIDERIRHPLAWAEIGLALAQDGYTITVRPSGRLAAGADTRTHQTGD